jgi:hypothetical protein
MRIFVVFLLLILSFFYVGALLLPKNLNVEEKKTIHSPKDSVFQQLNCLKKWERWSPFQANILENKYSGNECGSGSRLEWKDEKNTGIQKIIASYPADSIVYSWIFNGGDEAISKMILRENKYGTQVTWKLDAKMNYPWGYWVSYFLLKPNTEATFQKGLHRLDSLLMR